MRFIKGLAASLFLCLATPAFASTSAPPPPKPSFFHGHVGLSAFVPVIADNPPNLHGYRVSVWYQPDSWIWSHLSVYLDAGFSHLYVTDPVPDHSLSIYFISPILRYDFRPESWWSPFIRLGIGAAWMTRTQLGNRGFGIHYTFQDQAGVGVSLAHRRFSIILSALHYSNGHLSSQNSGITIPLTIGVEYEIE